MAKQTLYQILDVAEDASGEGIQRAFEDRRRAIFGEFDGEDRRNHLGFLEHARQVLTDPTRRAAYDRQNRSDVFVLEPHQAGTRSGRKLFVGLLVLGAGVLLGRQFLPRTQLVASAPLAAQAASGAPRKPAVGADLPSMEEVGAAFSAASGGTDAGAPPPTAAAIAPLPAAKPPAARIVLTVPGDPLMNRILGSTYAIVGSQGLGTGVAIEADRLLTNCHVISPNVLKGKIYAVSAATGASFEITDAAFLVKEDACVVHAPGLAGQPMALGDTSQLRPGARLHNIGFGGGKLTLAQGRYLGSLVRFGQSYMVSTNFCIPGVSGGPLVDDDGRLIGLTSGGTKDARGNSLCASLTVETARAVLTERMMQIDAFPTLYLTNWTGRR